MALEQAVADARRTDDTGVPNHLRDSHCPGARQLGRGKGYQYPHDFPGNYVAQQYLPDSLAHKRYYRPGTNGYERRLRRWLEKTKGLP